MAKVVIFLQNMYFNDPERMRKQLETSFKGDRERFIRTWLFWSCKTGEVLKCCFTDAVINHSEVVFEEQSPEIGDHSAAAFPPDFEHIERVLMKHQPKVVVALGRIAGDALRAIESRSLFMPGTNDNGRWQLLLGPHPAARDRDVGTRLIALGDALRRILYP